MGRILVTGASGFIGRALAPALIAQGHDVIAPGRAEIGDIGPNTDWTRALAGAEIVVHLAGLAHARYGAAALERVNAEGTRRLAEQAARAGIARFVFVSSVKAAADRSNGRALTESDTPAPGTPYGRSKLLAERTVLSFENLHPVALRPPLVHGPDARANFAALMRLASTPLPLPFASSRNRRSLISRTSLIAAIVAVLAQPAASGAFYVADRPALSTGEMIAALRQGLGRPARLFAAPMLAKLGPGVLRDDLEIDDAKFRAAFGFQGEDSRAALAATAAAWNTQAR